MAESVSMQRLIVRTRDFARRLEGSVIPNTCVFCGAKRKPDEVAICPGCRADLPWAGHSCPSCALPMPVAMADGLCCANCQQQPPPFNFAIAPLVYEFPVDAAIKAIKYRRKLHYLPAFASILRDALTASGQDVEAMLPVPLHYLRQTMRGFNQAEELARLLRRDMGLPILNVVRRVRATPSQTGLGAKERHRNLRGAFAMTGSVAANHVLIVDDVVTTGATAAHLTGLLQSAGAEKVGVLAIARAMARD